MSSPARQRPIPVLPERASEDRADAAMRRAERDASPHLGQANRGLRMILIAVVLIVLISWTATVALAGLRYAQVVALISTDQDALRVMCAVEPPDETQFGLMHICETVAGVERAARGE